MARYAAMVRAADWLLAYCPPGSTVRVRRRADAPDWEIVVWCTDEGLMAADDREAEQRAGRALASEVRRARFVRENREQTGPDVFLMRTQFWCNMHGVLFAHNDDSHDACVFERANIRLQRAGHSDGCYYGLNEPTVVICSPACNVRAVYCEHANENPALCQCPADCYCKTHTCKNRPPCGHWDLCSCSTQLTGVRKVIQERLGDEALAKLVEDGASREAREIVEWLADDPPPELDLKGGRLCRKCGFVNYPGQNCEC